MSVIEVKTLTKIYQVHQKEPGFVGTVKSLFARKYQKIKAVQDISSQIEEDEPVGFIGPVASHGNISTWKNGMDF